MTRVEAVDLGDVKAVRITKQPVWRWSECIRPVVGAERCLVRHVGAVVSGRLGVSHDDGSEIELGPGDAYVIEPGHDAWVIGDTVYVCHEFETVTDATFATPAD